MGKKAEPVRVITSADLVDNGGQYKLISKDAIKVSGDGTLDIAGGKPIVVYPVPDSEIGDYNLIQGEPVPVSEAPVSRGRASSKWAYPVYHDGPGTWPLDSDYLAYEGAMAVSPSETWRTAANQLFVSWKSALGVDALSDAMDIAYIFAAETEQAALLNMVKRAHDCTDVNAVAFEASRGFTGNGSTSYLNTNYNPATQGVNYALDSACLGVYSRTNSQIFAGIDMGCFDDFTASYLLTRDNSDRIEPYVNVFGGVLSNTNSSSLIVADRSSSGNTNAYRSGSSIVTDSTASDSVPSLVMMICAVNYNGTIESFTNRQYSCAFSGRSMSSQEHLATYNAWQTFLTAIGAQV